MAPLSRAKLLLFRAVMAAIVGSASAAAWLGYRRYQERFAAAEWPRRARHTLYYLTHPETRRLMDELLAMYSETFETVWNQGLGIQLSKKLYRDVRMGERTGFVYRPGVTKLMFAMRIWGGELLTYEVPATERAREIVRRLPVFHLAEASYDGRGFRRSGLPPNPGLPVALFAGDSFTDGHLVDDDETFVHHFGLRSTAARYAYPVNAGVSGYSAMEEYFSILLALRSEPDIRLVVLSHYPNDVHHDYSALVRGNIADPEPLWRENFLWLDKVRALCGSRGIRLAVVALPAMEQVLQESPQRRHYQDRMADWARRRGVPLLDPLDELRRRGGGSLYIPWDGHFTAEGNRVYAELVWDFVRRLYPSLKASA